MSNALQTIIQDVSHRLSEQLRIDLPAGLAAIMIALGGLLAALAVRQLLMLLFRRLDLDARMRACRFLGMLHLTGALTPSRVLVQGTYWLVLALTAISALQVAGWHIAGRVSEWLIMVAPRLGASAAILLGGMWLALYLGRSALIWAVNEDLPGPRKLALGVRLMVTFAAIAVGADVLNVGGGLFRAIFIVVLAGVVLSLSLAIGLGSREIVRRYLEERIAVTRQCSTESADPERLWNHL